MKREKAVSTFIMEKLEDWADIMRAKIPIKDYPNGWFGKHLRCAKGSDIFTWVLEHAPNSDRKKATLICQKMLEKDLI